jgi:sporulation protein YlmC with PRC-barrel domain
MQKSERAANCYEQVTSLGSRRVLLAWRLSVFNDGFMSWIKRWAVFAAGVAAGFLAVLPGVAAEQGIQSESPVVQRDFATNYPPERLSYLTRASDLIGTPVWDRTGHALGRIEDFVVDWNSGRVYCALIWPQHLYGASNYFIAVPAKCFVAADASRAVINTNLPTLIGSTRFLRAGWDATAVSNAVAEAYRRFGEPLSWDEKSGPGAVGKYSDLMGVEVNNRANVNIGNLADLVFDLPTERIMFAVVSFYGVDHNLHGVPFSAVSIASDRKNLVVDVDDSKVGALVNPDDFLRVKMTDPFWVADQFWAYGKEPGFSKEAWTQPAAPTSIAAVAPEKPTPVVINPEPLSGDVKLARAVMVSIIQADLANADLVRGIKISAVDGVVTLSGSVPGGALKSAWEKIAGSVAGVGSVKNELEIK